MSIYCIFAAHYLPYLGGVERYTYNMAKELLNRGNRVIVVTSEMHGEAQKEISDGIEIIRTDSWSIMNDRLPFFFMDQQEQRDFRLSSRAAS